MKKQHIPNFLTLLRLVVIAPLIWALVEGRFALAFWLFIAAGISDGVDGYLARRYHWQSRFGSIADPVVDKLLLMTMFILLATMDALPWWLIIVVVARDLIIVSGAFAYHYAIGQYSFKPSWVSKVNTVLQIFLIVCVLFQLSYHDLPSLLISVLIYGVFATTSISLISYIWVWGRKAWLNWGVSE